MNQPKVVRRDKPTESEQKDANKKIKAFALERVGMLASVVEYTIVGDRVISRSKHVEDLPAIAEQMAMDLIHDEIFK